MADLPVLIIDDEKHLCALFTDILARENIEVQSANTAKAGLEILADEANEFGVVFSDVKLPDLNGIEVLKEIKRRRPQMPVVMVTGHASKETAVEAMRLGAYDYLSKP
ncbi:MAG TPA: response regulator, partial [Abditibacteriaceae bacterium]